MAHTPDITHAGYHFANTLSASPRQDTDVLGEIRAVTSDELSQVDPDLILFNAAAPLPEDATDRGAREAELKRNLAIVDDVATDLSALDPVR